MNLAQLGRILVSCKTSNIIYGEICVQGRLGSTFSAYLSRNIEKMDAARICFAYSAEFIVYLERIWTEYILNNGRRMELFYIQHKNNGCPIHFLHFMQAHGWKSRYQYWFLTSESNFYFTLVYVFFIENQNILLYRALRPIHATINYAAMLVPYVCRIRKLFLQSVDVCLFVLIVYNVFEM